MKPRFSIVIPTRDRSEWLEQSLAAALAQTFADIEVVVVNNDSVDSAASESIAANAKDRRVRHVRTGGVGMAENWQVGVESALGEFVVVCSDKLRLLPWLLERADDLLQDESVGAVVWKIGDHTFFSDTAPAPLKTLRVEGVDIIKSAADGSWRLFLNAGARGMTSVFRRTLAAKVSAELGAPICRQACPDFTMALSLAALGVRNIYIDHVGAVFLPSAHGNGYRCLTAQDEATVHESFEVPDMSFLPTTYMAAVNGIYHDVVSTMNMMSPEKRIPINWEMYFVNLVHEAVDADDLGGFASSRRRELIRAIGAKPLKFRLSLLKTILVQECTNLLKGRRRLSYQLSRTMRLLCFPARGLFAAG